MKAIFRFYSSETRRIVGDIETDHKSIEQRRLAHAGYQFLIASDGKSWEETNAKLAAPYKATPNRIETDAEFDRIQVLTTDSSAPAVPRYFIDELDYRLASAGIKSTGGEDYGSVYYFYYQAEDNLLKVQFCGGSALKSDTLHFYERADKQDVWQPLVSAPVANKIEDLDAVYNQVFNTSKMPARWQWI